MAKQNVLEAAKDHMRELQELKTTDLETIEKKKQEARTQLEAAALAMRRATEVLDMDAYAEAEAGKRKAQTALAMYSARYEQIEQQEYISESESDKTIDALLEYEEELAADFKAAIAAPLQKLDKILADYLAAVKDAEDVITAWQRDVHANYSTRGASTRIDPFTGERTDRSETPVLVHRFIYDGCKEAGQLRDYLKKAEELCKG